MKKSTISGNPFQRCFRFRSWVFPACITGVYLVLLFVMPDRTWDGLQAAGRVLMQAAVPLFLAFGMMFLLNLFISPVYVSNFLGKGAGVKGVLFSAIAGIISMGPIFAWYPFLESLRKKGASELNQAFNHSFDQQLRVGPIYFDEHLVGCGVQGRHDHGCGFQFFPYLWIKKEGTFGFIRVNRITALISRDTGKSLP